MRQAPSHFFSLTVQVGPSSPCLGTGFGARGRPGKRCLNEDFSRPAVSSARRTHGDLTLYHSKSTPAGLKARQITSEPGGCPAAPSVWMVKKRHAIVPSPLHHPQYSSPATQQYPITLATRRQHALTQVRARSSRLCRTTPGRMMPSSGVTSSSAGSGGREQGGACYLTPSHPLSHPTHSQAPRPAATKNFLLPPHFHPAWGWSWVGPVPRPSGPEDEDVHGAHLGELVIRPIQPEDLLAALFVPPAALTRWARNSWWTATWWNRSRDPQPSPTWPGEFFQTNTSICSHRLTNSCEVLQKPPVTSLHFSERLTELQAGFQASLGSCDQLATWMLSRFALIYHGLCPELTSLPVCSQASQGSPLSWDKIPALQSSIQGWAWSGTTCCLWQKPDLFFFSDNFG